MAAVGDIFECLLEEEPRNWSWSPVGSVWGILKSTAVLPYW